MNQEIVRKFELNKANIENTLKGKLDTGISYETLVKLVFKYVIDADSEETHFHYSGDWQGDLICKLKTPEGVYRVVIGYGSCSYCDILEGILDYDNKHLTRTQIQDLMNLCLNIAQWTEFIPVKK